MVTERVGGFLILAQLGFGDIIQPHLLQLQPSLDESMDTLPPLPVPYGGSTGV